MSSIHPSAIVHPSVRIASGVQIGPYCVIEEGAVIREGCHLFAHVWVGRGTTLGKNNVIHVGAVIGASAQHRAVAVDSGKLEIGDENTFREYVTIHRSSAPDAPTRIGNHNYLMAFSHVGHDCRLGDNITIANATVLGGHVVVEDKCVISGHVAIHQFCRIGTMAMVGGQSSVTKDVPPYMIIDNNDEYIASLNLVGMKRGGLSDAEIREIKKAYRRLYYGEKTIAEAARDILSESPPPAVKILADFILSSKRGLAPHRRDAAGAAEITA
jgi:UDP-N-acetylglucosamine acyltransferase